MVNLQQFHGGWRMGGIHYQKLKMKVKIAIQLVASRSVYDTLRYCHAKNFPGFECKEDVKATTDFCLVNDQIWDLLNTKDKFGQGCKSPLSPKSIAHHEKILKAAENMYKDLYLDKEKDSTPLTDSLRKTGPLGILANIKGIRHLIDEMGRGTIGLDYLLAYKLQQDHLEVIY